MSLPKLGEGWSWRTARPNIRCTNPKCCQETADGHSKVLIELLLHDDVRRHGLIDVEFYGDTRAVAERAQAMLNSVVQEQIAGLTYSKYIGAGTDQPTEVL